MIRFLLTCFLFLSLSKNLAAQGIMGRPDSTLFPPPYSGQEAPSSESLFPAVSEAPQPQGMVPPSVAEQEEKEFFRGGQPQAPQQMPPQEMSQQPAPPQQQMMPSQMPPQNIFPQGMPPQQQMMPPQTMPPQMMMPPQSFPQSAPPQNFQNPLAASPLRVENDKKSLAIFDAKKPTPSRFFTADISMPDNFSTSNNLAKKVGSFYRAFGEVIFVQGTVTDSFGVPVEGAIIEIWQANAAGKYHTLLDPDSEYIDKYFNMSGRAVTDNLGAYDFITIMPGSSPGRAPHINANIYHPKFGKIETEMYFAGHPYNSSDYQYLAYSEEDRKLLTAIVRRSNLEDKNSIKVCTFNIVMRGVHQYKTY